MLFSTLSVVFLLPFAFGSPTARSPAIKLTGCPVSTAIPPLPAGQSVLTVPAGQTVSHIGLGLGVQNYTCTAAGVYTSAGAVAELLDVSCLYGTPVFSTIENTAFDVFNANNQVTVNDVIDALGGDSVVLGQHYFVINPVTGTGLSPQFDFRAASQKGDPNAFVTTSKVGDIPAPTGTQDVDWLELVNIRGDLAKTVFRLTTRAGQPPASCAAGSPLISVKYTATYWFLN